MTASRLKVIALISMAIDHAVKTFFTQDFLLNTFGIPYGISYFFMLFFLFFGRIAFPVFAFFVAEGCLHTHNKGKYLLRLLIFAAVAEIPFQLAFNGTVRVGATNVIVTLLLGALACFTIDFLRKRGIPWLAVLPVAVLCAVAELCKTDYGAFGIVFVVTPYLFTTKKRRTISLAALVTVFYMLYIPLIEGSLTWLQGDWWPILYWGGALVPVFLLHFYNGQRGKGSKWTFYLFYPLHLLAFYGLSVVFI